LIHHIYNGEIILSKIEELVRDNLLTDCGKNIRVYITDDKVKYHP